MATNAEKLAAAQKLLAKNKKLRSFAKEARTTGWKPPKAGQTMDTTPATRNADGSSTATSYTRYVKQEDHNRAYGGKAGFIPPLKIKTPTSSRPTKITYGHGKDKDGKSLGITTVVDAGHNPSAAKIRTATRMAKNQRPNRRGTAPQAKAPKSSAPKLSEAQKQFKREQNQPGPRRVPGDPNPPSTTWKPLNVSKVVQKRESVYPRVPYGMKDTAASSKPKVPTSFSAKNIAGALLATAAAVTTGVVAKQQLSGQPRRKGDAVAKRNRSPQIEAAHNRKPVDPAKVRATAIGARREQGDPYKRNKTNVQNAVRAAEAADARNSRPPMAGGDRGNLRSNRDQVRDAIQATERADAREKARFQAPPEAAPKVEDTKVEPKSTPTEFAPKQSVASRIRDAFRPTDEFREIQAARKRGQAAPTTVTPPTSTEQPSVGRRIVAATSDLRSP
jgi:hypothetical protein